MPPIFASGRLKNISKEIQLYVTFGLFASNSPVESPKNKELFPLFFAGDMERERGTKGSSWED